MPTKLCFAEAWSQPKYGEPSAASRVRDGLSETKRGTGPDPAPGLKQWAVALGSLTCPFFLYQS
jgi:hypothetical protein